MSCRPCLGALIKSTLLDALPGLEDILKEIPDCEQEADIEFCVGTSERGKKKRAPSAYNKHTGTCMKTGKSMKECAAEWHQKKGV